MQVPDIFVARDEYPGLTCDHECQRVVFVKGSFTKECMAVEEEIYKLLGHTAGFPGLRWSGDWDGMYWIVLDYVGCNLHRLHSNLPDFFNPQTVAVFAVQMVRLFYTSTSAAAVNLQ